MRKRLFYLVNFLGLLLSSVLLYYLLVQDTAFRLSISGFLDFANHCTKNGHILVIGLLPIYLGLIIFGAALLYLRLRSRLWPILSQHFKQWLHIKRKS